jgi:hypothetical protein
MLFQYFPAENGTSFCWVVKNGFTCSHLSDQSQAINEPIVRAIVYYFLLVKKICLNKKEGDVVWNLTTNETLGPPNGKFQLKFPEDFC